MQNDTCYILALIKRDDGERLLLGSGFYQFNKEQKHFNPNVFANDIVELQGADGQLLAGQVRRSSAQSFDGYIGDGTTSKQTVEQKRREFFLFFRKQHHYTVVYIMPDGTAIKRDRGYIVDAPAVQELYQVQPKWHIAIAFEDVNYYSYAEDAQGNEIYSFTQMLGLANITDGGLIWDNAGAISSPTGLANIRINGDTFQQTYPSPNPDYPQPIQTVTGEQTVTIGGTNYTVTLKSKNMLDTGQGFIHGYIDNSGNVNTSAGDIIALFNQKIAVQSGTTYVFSSNHTNQNMGVSFWKNDGTFISRSVIANTAVNSFTPPSACAYIMLQCRYGDIAMTQSLINSLDLMLELGSTPSVYVPFLDIELCKLGTYRDYIWKDGDDWKVHKATGKATRNVEVAGIKLNNSSGPTMAAEAGAFAIFINSFPGIATARASENIGVYKQDASVTGNAGANAMADGTFCQRQGTNDRCYFRNTAYIGKTGNEMRALLLANSGGANAYYYLSTPTDTTITDTTLIAQLNAIEEAMGADGKPTAIVPTGTNLAAIITGDPNGTGGYIWAPSTGGGPVTVTVDGVDSANPVWHVFGACTNPTLTNSTTGQALTWNGDVPAGQELIIDMGAQTATLEGANVFEFVSGSWIQLAPGTNRISYTAANTTQDSKIEWNEIVG